MQILVSGQHMELGNALQDHAKGRLSEIVQRYLDHATKVDVHFSKEGARFTCNIIVHDGTGRHTVIKGQDSANDAYVAFDAAVSKVEQQLRKYKSKLKDRHDRVKISQITPAVKYVLSPHQSEIQEEQSDNPVIIAEKPAEIEEFSVSEAVMKMDLQDLPALMFKNSKNGRINVVYYRKDGNISWVDSARE